MSRASLEMVWGGGRKLFGKYLKALGFPFSNGLIPLQLPCRGWKAQLCFSNTCLASYKCLGTWWVFTTPWCAVLGACRPRFRRIRGAGEEHAVAFAFLYLFLNWDFFSPSQLELKKLSSISFPVPPPMFFFFFCFVLLWFDCYSFKYQDILGTSKQTHPKNLTVLRT